MLVIASPLCQDNLVDVDKEPCYCKLLLYDKIIKQHRLTMALDEKKHPSIVEEKENAGDFSSYLVSCNSALPSWTPGSLTP